MEEKRNTDNNIKSLSRMHFLVFFFILLVMGCLFFLLARDSFSELENRNLTRHPQFSLQSLRDGDFTDSLDMFFSDNFPFREEWVEFSFLLKDNFGFQATDVKVYKDVQNIETEDWLEQTDTVIMNDTTLSVSDTSRIADNVEDKTKGIVIFNGYAIQLFGGKDFAAKNYAKIINNYKKELKDNVRIFNILVPSTYDFILGKNEDYPNDREKGNIEVCYSSCSAGIICPDVYSEFVEHKDEYLFYRTDHHVTARAGYYAYKAFCNEAGFPPVPLEDFKYEAYRNFKGSLYRKTRDPKLKENPDTVEVFRPTIKTSARIIHSLHPLKSEKGALLGKGYSRGSYHIFLGGDHGLLEVGAESTNGRKAAIVKNSMGNIFAPYLVNHYDTVYVIDYRYFDFGLINLIVEKEIDDLIFFNNAMMANSSYHMGRIKKIMWRENKRIEIPKATVYQGDLKLDSVVIDSIAVDTVSE